MQYQYEVVPFMGSIKAGQGINEVTKQLQSLINQYVGKGWELQQISDVKIEVRPGCLAALFGAQTSYIIFNQIVFRKPAS